MVTEIVDFEVWACGGIMFPSSFRISSEGAMSRVTGLTSATRLGYRFREILSAQVQLIYKGCSFGGDF